MTEAQLRQAYVDKAVSYLGATEGDSRHKEIVDTYNEITPLPVGYRLQYSDDWCAGFVSAMAQLCGITSVVLPECSCTRMIALYQAKGRWQENDAYVPQMGDLIMYEWSDTGSGDLTGDADHVGIVTACNGSTITVIEGNKNNCVEYRTVSVNGMYVRGFCLPDFAAIAGSSGGTPDSKVIWDYLLEKIGNKYGVAGLMGNLEAESGLHSDRVQGDIPYSSYSKEYTAKVDSGAISEYDFVHNGPGGGGYGLAQWTYSSRKQALYNMWKSGNYTSIGSLGLALDYLWKELTEDYAGVLSTLKSATSVREASDKVLHGFENPADQSASVEAKRAAMGQVWYDLYKDSVPGGGSDEPGWQPTNRKKLSLLLLIAASKRSGR